MPPKKVSIVTPKDDGAGKILSFWEQAFIRPDTYIGSKITQEQVKMWVYDDDTKSMLYKNINYNPGLVHIFIESISNAIDNLWRSMMKKIIMTKIHVTVDLDLTSETFGWITILNDGYAIPAKIFTYKLEGGIEKDMYPVQAFFFNILAGTNFEDDATRKTSGKNGIGAKTVVVYSKECIIEHTDPINKKKVILKASNNGKIKEEPKVTSFTGKNGYTKVSFLPDYDFFGFDIKNETNRNDYYCMLKRLTFGCAMITKLTVQFNGEKIKMETLLKYAKLYYPDTKFLTISSGSTSDLRNSECVFCEKTVETNTKGLEEFSWINGIHTTKNGIHIDAYSKAIIPRFVKLFNEKNSKGKNPLKATSAQVEPFLALFVRAEAPTPSFTTQTKEEVLGIYDANEATKVSKKFPIDLKKEELDDLVDKMYKWDFIKELKNNLLDKKDDVLDKKSKVGKKRVKCENYRKANNAGKDAFSKNCVLYITEGKSAQTFAEALCKEMPGGLDMNGTLAIKGKLLNTIKATKAKLGANVEVTAIREILGLDYGVDYSKIENRKKLNYGTVMIMSDQDDDGFHIRGLIIAFLNHYWPTLISSDPLNLGKSLIQSFTTAVVMIRETPKAVPLMFFSNPEFKKYMETHTVAPNKIKYYKGLGTHRPETDAKLYMGKNMKVLEYIPDPNAKRSLNIWFSDEKDDQSKDKFSKLRKREMLKRLPKPDDYEVEETTTTNGVEEDEDEGDVINEEIEGEDEDEEVEEENNEVEDIIDEDKFQSFGKINISYFCDNHLMIFNLRSLWRAIPNIYDGLKHGQRKVLSGTPKRKTSMRLDTLASQIVAKTAYHHGAVSLEGTIVNMAQSFPGSNNIPLLFPDGAFGSRAKDVENGKKSDVAAARYIYSKLQNITQYIYPEEDDPVLEKDIEDGKVVGYKYYVPIIPMLLVNGSSGIATGFKTDFAQYNPLDLIEWIEKWLNFDETQREEDTPNMSALKPWYRGFKGNIKLENSDSNGWYKNWTSTGIISSKPDAKGWYDITELPVGLWTDPFIQYLEEISYPSVKNKKGESMQQLIDYQIKANDDYNIHIRVLPLPNHKPDINNKNNFASKLKNTNSLNNMYAINEFGYPIKFSCVEHLMNDFCKKRLELYLKRKEYLLKKYNYDREKATNIYKFINSIISKEFEINKYENEQQLEEALLEKGYKKMSNTFTYSVGGEEKELILDDDMEGEDNEDAYAKNEEKTDKKINFNYLLNINVRSQTKQKVKLFENASKEAEEKYKILSEKSLETLWKEDLDKFKVEYQLFLKENS